VHFAACKRLVSGVGDKLRELRALVEGLGIPVFVHLNSVRVPTRHQDSAGRDAYRALAKGSIETHALGGEFVDLRCHDDRMSTASEPVAA
jgi:hypothetical protein